MRVHVFAFARVRESLGAPERIVELPAGARIRDVWAALREQYPAIEELVRSTRVARNGTVVTLDDAVHDGDELALLPPVGGG